MVVQVPHELGRDQFWRSGQVDAVHVAIDDGARRGPGAFQIARLGDVQIERRQPVRPRLEKETASGMCASSNLSFLYHDCHKTLLYRY